MNFFENACRIPLIVHAPGRFVPHRVSEPASLLDILPTLNGSRQRVVRLLNTPADRWGP